MVTTIEFYQKGKTIYVEFNSKTHTLAEFLQLKESRKMITKMYYKILNEYHKYIVHQVKNTSNMGEVVGVFIKRFFLKKDKVFDVVYYSDGNLIKFNIEGDEEKLS